MVKVFAFAVVMLFIAAPSRADDHHCRWMGGFWTCEHGWNRDGERERHEMWRERRHEERMREERREEWCRFHRC